MATPVPGTWENVKIDTDRAFVRALRENLIATELFPGRPRLVRDLGVQAFNFREIPEDTGATISMAIPEFQPTDGAMGAETVGEIPVFVKDAKVTERERLAMEYTGLDTVEAEEKGIALAKEIEQYLLFGKTGGPGATTGILNDAGILSTDFTGTTNFTVGNDVIKSLNAALATSMVNRFYGRKRIVMNPADFDLMGAFITNTSVQVEEKLNPQLRGTAPLFSERVTAGNLYIIDVSPTNYRAVVPRDIGAIGRPQRRSDVDEITGTMRMRWLTALGLEKRRPKAVHKVIFDRSG